MVNTRSARASTRSATTQRVSSAPSASASPKTKATSSPNRSPKSKADSSPVRRSPRRSPSPQKKPKKHDPEGKTRKSKTLYDRQHEEEKQEEEESSEMEDIDLTGFKGFGPPSGARGVGPPSGAFGGGDTDDDDDDAPVEVSTKTSRSTALEAFKTEVQGRQRVEADAKKRRRQMVEGRQQHAKASKVQGGFDESMLSMLEELGEEEQGQANETSKTTEIKPKQRSKKIITEIKKGNTTVAVMQNGSQYMAMLGLGPAVSVCSSDTLGALNFRDRHLYGERTPRAMVSQVYRSKCLQPCDKFV